MKNLNATDNAKHAFQNFALQYSIDGDVKFATICASDYLDTVQDVNSFEKMLALFLSGKLTATVDRINEDCTFRTETVKYIG